MFNSEFDVVVIGGGPGGSATAKRCAEHGLKTLLLEKRKLPRDKVCTGMIMSNMVQTLIKEEFGEFLPGVLTTPPYINGIVFHMSGVKSRVMEHRMPFAWRRDLDYWMNQKVRAVGGEIWDSVHVTGFRKNDKYIVSLQREEQIEEIKVRFIVGGDGATSVVRKSFFPNLKLRYTLCVRECYQGKLDLDERYVHYFYFPDLASFEVNCKGDVFLIETGATAEQLKKSNILPRAKELLAKEHRLDISSKPLWRDGCLEPLFHRELFSGLFSPAIENVLLVGDAAGLVKPVTGEGIGTAIKSGIFAADAIIKAAEEGRKAKEPYLEYIKDISSNFQKMYPPSGKIKEQMSKGGDYLLEVLNELFNQSIRIL